MEVGYNKKMKKKIKFNKIIKKIENTRTKNNINWMNILRIAMKYSPQETKKALKKINNQDQKISKLLKKIT
tara:strand:+ start:445 stop:657 length:213 start_codon:yes stop_codon:yes gene_type:complete